MKLQPFLFGGRSMEVELEHKFIEARTTYFQRLLSVVEMMSNERLVSAEEYGALKKRFEYECETTVHVILTLRPVLLTAIEERPILFASADELGIVELIEEPPIPSLPWERGREFYVRCSDILNKVLFELAAQQQEIERLWKLYRNLRTAPL